MQRCPRLHCGGVILNDAGRLVCHFCGETVRDLEPTTIEKMLSNMSPEEPDRHHGRRASIDLDAVKARVLAAVRRESGEDGHE